MRSTLNTQCAAYMLGVPPGILARTCREHGVEPVRRLRLGRSTVTLWDLDDLATVARALLSDGVSA